MLYLGRIDPNKGCEALIRHFTRYVESGREVQLVMAGPASMPIPDHPRIRPLGFVDEPVREALLSEARALIMPSPYESLSMVLLEAWNHGLPALVNARCKVLRGQVTRADGGLYYGNAVEFAAGARLPARSCRCRAAARSPGARLCGSRIPVADRDGED